MSQSHRLPSVNLLSVEVVVPGRIDPPPRGLRQATRVEAETKVGLLRVALADVERQVNGERPRRFLFFLGVGRLGLGLLQRLRHVLRRILCSLLGQLRVGRHRGNLVRGKLQASQRFVVDYDEVVRLLDDGAVKDVATDQLDPVGHGQRRQEGRRQGRGEPAPAAGMQDPGFLPSASQPLDLTTPAPPGAGQGRMVPQPGAFRGLWLQPPVEMDEL
jgi:hypothetical protein